MKYTVAKLPILAALFVATSSPISAQDPGDPYRKEDPTSSNSQLTKQAPLLSLRLDTISLPINEAFALLNEFSTDKARYDELTKRVSQGTAKIERLLVVRSKSGQRAGTESIREHRYAVDYTVTDPSANPAPHTDTSAPTRTIRPKSFETRNLGDTVEFEAVVSADNTMVDVNLVPQTVLHRGDHELTAHPGFPQPAFETQKTTTIVRTRIGQPFLLSTPNTTADKELEGQRIWFQFITLHVVDASGNIVNGAGQTSAPISR